MNFGRTLKIAWEGLTLNKVRSFLTTLGVIIGVAAVIVMMAVSAGAEASGREGGRVRVVGGRRGGVSCRQLPGHPHVRGVLESDVEDE